MDVHELHEMQSETNSVISMDEKLERKGYHQFAVEANHQFLEVGF